MKIESILATKSLNVITVRPDESLKDAIDLLVEHDIGALIVVDELGQPVGIISERDIIREAARTETVLAQTVARVMTKDLIVASPQDDLGAILQTMIAGHFRHLPIIDRER
ncbi:MAG: CBS domain-containing protein, partial [Acidobacteriota bacterium]